MTATSHNTAHRPAIAVTRHAIAAGHYLAATAGFDILQAGGNAIDAGVAAGIALGVVQSDLVNVAGVAPIMIYVAEKREVVTVVSAVAAPRRTRDLVRRLSRVRAGNAAMRAASAVGGAPSGYAHPPAPRLHQPGDGEQP